MENNESLACAIRLASRYGGLIRGGRACATHPSIAKESKAAGFASRNRLGKISNPPGGGERPSSTAPKPAADDTGPSGCLATF